MSVEHVIDQYCSVWSDSDREQRKATLTALWADFGSYTDPMAHVVGATALLDHIATVMAAYPGARIERTSDVQTHHDVARFAWRLSQPDGATLPEGLDVVIFNAEGKIERVIGFFGPLPARLIRGT